MARDERIYPDVADGNFSFQVNSVSPKKCCGGVQGK